MTALEELFGGLVVVRNGWLVRVHRDANCPDINVPAGDDVEAWARERLAAWRHLRVWDRVLMAKGFPPREPAPLPAPTRRQQGEVSRCPYCGGRAARCDCRPR